VNTELREWKRGPEPRRAAVSSFGFGGTNAHIILEEAPLRPARPVDDQPRHRVLVLSARSPEALEQRRNQLADHLEAKPDTRLGDAAWTLAVGRARMPQRLAVVADDVPSAIRLLREPDPAASAARATGVAGAEVAFLFTGQGA